MNAYQPTPFETACANIMTAHLNVGAFIVNDNIVGVFWVRVGTC